MSVYVRDDVTPEARAVVEQMLRESELVTDHEFVSKAEALSRFRRDFADLGGVTEHVTAYPFPASFEVRLNPDVGDAAAVERLASVLQGASGVEEVRFDQTWIERITSALGLLRGVGRVVVLVLVVAAALSVANVVRLACFARRDEIEIMQLVGAPLTYVRGPFVLEGVLQGGIGALAALLLALRGIAKAGGRADYRPGNAVKIGLLAAGSLLVVSASASLGDLERLYRAIARNPERTAWRFVQNDPRAIYFPFHPLVNLTNLGGGIEEISHVLAEREPVYRAVADKEFDVTHVAAKDALRHIIVKCL